MAGAGGLSGFCCSFVFDDEGPAAAGGVPPGLKADAFGFGLKLEALALNLNAADVEDVSDAVGLAGEPPFASEVGLLLVVLLLDSVRFRKGGIF